MISTATTEALTERRARAAEPRERSSKAGGSVVGKENGKPSDARPRVWKRAKDPRTGRTYYYDVHTRETQWEKPLELASPEERERIETKERELKSFFSAMEQNILRRVNEGLDVHDVQAAPVISSSPLRNPHLGASQSLSPEIGLQPAHNRRTSTPLDIGVPASYKKTEDTKHQAYPEFWGSKQHNVSGALAGLEASMPTRMVRTISHMDDSVLEQLKSTENEDLSANQARDLEDMAEEESPKGESTEDCLPNPGIKSMKTAPISRKRHSLMSVFFKTKPKEALDKKPRRRSTIRPRAERPKLDAAATPPRSSMDSSMVESLGAVPPPLRRNNSTSSIYVNETMAAPDKESTIKVVCCVIRAHMLSAAARDDAHTVDTVPPQFRVFVDRDYVRPQQRRPSFSRAFSRANTEEVEVPKLDTLVQFFRHVYLTAQMEVECIIMSLIYIEKLLKDTTGALQIRHFNWKSVLFAGMIMASKVWDDLSMWNVDFSAVCPSFSLRRINELELALLNLLKFNTTITASVYAKYYFHLRSMCATMGLGGDLREMQPLSIEDAQRLHISSKNYANRSALSRPTNERAVTLSEGLTQIRVAGDSSDTLRHRKSSSTKPALSLEEVVSMQSPTARSGHSSARSAETASTGRSTGETLTP